SYRGLLAYAGGRRPVRAARPSWEKFAKPQYIFTRVMVSSRFSIGPTSWIRRPAAPRAVKPAMPYLLEPSSKVPAKMTVVLVAEPWVRLLGMKSLTNHGTPR